MESKCVYKSHAEQATVLVKNCVSGANSHAFSHTPRCIRLVKENWASSRQKQLVLSSRSKTGTWWLMLGWTKCNQSVFSRSADPVLWLHDMGANDVCWDSSSECKHHQVASELPLSLRLVWISSELLSPVNYAHRCPGVQLGRLADASLIDLRQESENSFRLS